MESLSKCFVNAHGARLKNAFSEILMHLLHPIGRTAQAEVNHPQWAKAIEAIYPKAFSMLNKPRYWPTAYSLAVTSLCVAPHDYFLRNWVGLCDITLSKLKVYLHCYIPWYDIKLNNDLRKKPPAPSYSTV